MPFFVYLLLSTSGGTYIGATVDLNRRLRQHNKEIKGGAVATGRKINSGEIWERVVHIEGFPDWSAALQFEWRWKQISRKVSESVPINRRMIALQRLLALDKPTSKAKMYSEWPTPCIVVVENIDIKAIYDDLQGVYYVGGQADLTGSCFTTQESSTP